MVSPIESIFPKLQPSRFLVTSPPSDGYNCVAWAIGDTERWWWPADTDFWPPSADRIETVAAFVQAFATLGYSPANTEELEAGVEKIALFAQSDGVPTHVARQQRSGRWTSKLGRREDIEHYLRDLEGEAYGVVVQILQRPTSAD